MRPTTTDTKNEPRACRVCDVCSRKTVNLNNVIRNDLYKTRPREADKAVTQYYYYYKWSL